LVAFLWYRQRKPNVAIYSSRTQSRVEPPRPWLSGLLKAPRTKAENSTNPNPSQFSFNPSLFVRPMINRSRTLLFRPPPPIVTVEPLHGPLYPGDRPDSLRPLQPNRTPSPPPSVIGDPRTLPVQPISIQAWQQRTHLEAEATPPRLSIAEVDLSSYWEMTTSAEPQPMTTPQRIVPPRRFTVVNN